MNNGREEQSRGAEKDQTRVQGLQRGEHLSGGLLDFTNRSMPPNSMAEFKNASNHSCGASQWNPIVPMS